MSWSIGAKLGLVIGGASLVIVAAVDVISHSHLTGLIDVAGSLTKTYELLDDLDAVLLHLQNAETGQRGFILTGEASYLEPYQAAVRSIDADIAQLRALLDEGGRHAHQDRFERLRGLVGDKLAELDETIRARRQEGFEAARRLVLTDRGKRIMDQIRSVIEEIRAEENEILHAQRAAVEASARATIVIIVAGSVLGLVLLAAAGVIIQRDVRVRRRAQAERARLEESLRRSETMSAMGSLVAGVAHEVRNPLFGITSALDAMEARLGEREEYRRYLEVLRAELERLTRLMQQLLNYGKPPNPTFVPARVDEVIADAVMSARPLTKAAELAVRVEVAPSLPRASIDGERLLQVMQNIVENAIQHSPSGGTVTVQALPVEEQGRRWLELAVQDDGPGFREDDLPHVLEPFFSRRRGGTGLGLAIVQRIVEGYGGRIITANRPEGGATVAVRLPVVDGGPGVA